MALLVENLTIDTHDPDRLADWWARALGAEAAALVPGEFVTVALPSGLTLGFQHVEDPTPGKNRLHLDFKAEDVETEVERLVSLGATETARHSFGDDFRWVVLTDPDGNQFCVG